VNKVIFFYGRVSRDWIAERIKAALQLIITNNYPIKDLYIFMIPPHKNPKEIPAFNTRFIPVKVIDNSDTTEINSERLQEFFKSINTTV